MSTKQERSATLQSEAVKRKKHIALFTGGAK